MADMIGAVATGGAVSAIGILRLSGDGCAQAAGRVFFPVSGKSLEACPARKLVLGDLKDKDGRLLDRCLGVWTPGPNSYTGEDTVELQCHGSPAVLSAGLEALFRQGVRQAGRGEFTKRAFLNGRMDLTQAEAVIDLIEAETAEAAANAAGQVAGRLLARVQPVYDELRDLCSHFHAVLDYPDEDIDDFQLSAYEKTLARAKEALRALLATFRRGRVLTQGLKAAILGRPNVGKSSLLNALAGYDRVIVTDVPGTTRDTVEERLQIGGVLLRLQDTAGIRDTADPVEALGVQRSRAAAEDAELAIFVCDGSKSLEPEDFAAMDAAKSAEQALAVVNKSDLPQALSPSDLPFDTVISLSAKTGQGLEELESWVESRFGSKGSQDGTLLTNARQAEAVSRAAEALERAQGGLSAGMTPDAVLTDVEAAMSALGELTGATVREDITNRIFERFCVGK